MNKTAGRKGLTYFFKWGIIFIATRAFAGRRFEVEKTCVNCAYYMELTEACWFHPLGHGTARDCGEYDEKTYDCPECDKVFTDFAEAEKHINDCIAYNDIRRNDL